MKHFRLTMCLSGMALSLLTLLLTLPVSICFGQWRLIASLGEPVQSIYFLDQLNAPHLGFVGTANGVWRSSDSGNTWTKVTQFDQASDFAFKDSLTGWCSSRSSPGCYETTDMGITWKPLPINTSGEAVGYVWLSHLLLLSSWSRGEFSSSDDGASWQNWNPNRFNGFSFGTDSLGIVGNSPQLLSPLLFTRDGGITWRVSDLSQEAWQVLMVKGTPICFAVGENGGGLNTSVDGGMSWKPMTFAGLHGRLTGCIRGSLCDLYLQGSDGVYSSRSGGRGWEFIGGPGNVVDTRFCASGYTIYAGDTLGNIWSYNDTVISYDEVVLTLDSTSVHFDTLGNCQSKEYALHFSNYLACDSIAIDSMIWDVANPTIDLVNSMVYPHVLQPFQEDSLVFRYTPTIGGKTSTASLRLKIVLAGVEHDTVISLAASSFATPRATLSNASLNFDTLSTCDTGVRTFTISNASCDSINVSLTASPSGGFSFITPWNNYKIAGDETDTFRIALHSSSPASAFSFLQLQFVPSIGSPYGYTLNLLGTVIPGSAAVSLADTTINFGSVSTCSNAMLSTFFTSTGCDSLGVTGEVLSAQNGFSVLNAHVGSLAVGAKDSILVKFVPPGVGKFYDTLSITTNVGVKKVYVSAQGAAGTKVLSIDSTLRNFGTNSVCRIADTSIIFKNTGCDSLTVENVTLVGQNYLLNGSKTPKVLAPGSSDTIAVQFIPTIAGTATGTVTLRTNADQDSIVNIPFTAQSVAPQTLALQTALSRTNIPTGDTTTLFVTPASTVTVSGLTTLSSTISYDGDLLTYVPMTATAAPGFALSNPVETRFGKTSTLRLMLTATGNPTTFTEGQTLASVRFRTTLTDSLSTPITLGNLVLNDGDSLFNRCTLSLNDSNTSFTLALNCVDSVINATLRGMLPFVIQSITPNPTDGKLTVNITESTSVTIQYDILDLLGHSVKFGTLGAGANTLDIGSLPNGSYFLRTSNGSEVLTRRIQLLK